MISPAKGDSDEVEVIDTKGKQLRFDLWTLLDYHRHTQANSTSGAGHEAIQINPPASTLRFNP
ncbi:MULTISPECIES: hypothetical protein [unclassified Phyllobacterium]|uniref:hypothetical protein n=1 Tax=unclassified Phyllobacterium TaxID=2638441 RepID=UPI003012B1C6